MRKKLLKMIKIIENYKIIYNNNIKINIYANIFVNIMNIYIKILIFVNGFLG